MNEDLMHAKTDPPPAHPTEPAPPILVKGQLVLVVFRSFKGRRYEFPDVDGADAQRLSECFPAEWRTFTVTNVSGATLTVPVADCDELFIDGYPRWVRS
jgi:hypothetical protein